MGASPAGTDSQSELVERADERPGLGLKLFDLLKGTPWLGRPLHPALSYAPIGAWLTAAVLDILGLKRGADRAVELGNFGSFPTMLAGCVDWYETSGRERRVGFVHMCVNCTGMMFYMQSAMARSAGQRKWGITLSTVGLATVLVGSWVGTDLVVKYGMGVSPSAWAWLRRRRPADQQRQTQQGGFAMMGMCPLCGRMVGGTQGGQQMPQSVQDPNAIRQQIQVLQQRLDELETVQRLRQQVQQLEERVRTLEAPGQQPNQ